MFPGGAGVNTAGEGLGRHDHAPKPFLACVLQCLGKELDMLVEFAHNLRVADLHDLLLLVGVIAPSIPGVKLTEIPKDTIHLPEWH